MVNEEYQKSDWHYNANKEDHDKLLILVEKKLKNNKISCTISFSSYLIYKHHA
jgi:hypothetical protein